MSIRNAGSMKILVPQSALFFDGHNTNVDPNMPRVIVGTSTGDLNIAATGKLTISAWIKPKDLPSAGYIFSKRDDTVGTAYGFFAAGSNLQIFGGNQSSSYSANGSITIDVWQHVACTLDNTTASIYINGELFGGDTITGIAQWPTVSGAIGCRFGGTSYKYGYSGSITNLQVWSGAALDEFQIKRVYNGIDVETDYRICNFKFDDNEGDTLTNYANKSNDGDIANATWIGRQIQCWNTRWDEGNWDVTVETFLNPCDRNFIAQHITPGAVKEMYNILGTPANWDITYSSGNTLTFIPIGGTGLSGLREQRTIGIKNFTDTFITKDYLGIKLEGLRLDI